MNIAKSTRRVMSLWRMGSPTWLLQTGRPWLAPSSKWLPRTTVQRVSLAKTRRVASTWSSRSAKRPSRARRRLAGVAGGERGPRGGGAPADIDQGLELPCVDVLAVDGYVPPAREDESCFGLSVVENRLRRPGRIAVHATRDEDREDAVAAGDRPLDDVAVVGRARDDGDLAVEAGGLGDALLTAHGDYFVAAAQREPAHVFAELA